MSAGQQLLNSEANRDDDAEESLWTKFTQQRLKAWQISLPPRFAIACYLVGGFAFFATGISLLFISWGVQEHTLEYTDVDQTAEYADHVGFMELTIPRDMEPPIWIYYELDGFHQNHRRYVKSRSNSQLEAAEPMRIDDDALAACAPAVLGDAGRPFYPCGLVARSVFNDSFALVVRESIPEGESAKPKERWKRLKIDSSARTIAWPADVDGGKFANYDPETKHSSGLQNQELLDMWIINRFPPVTCVQNSISNGPELRYKPVYVATKEVKVPANTAAGTPERTVRIADCTGYLSDNPKCNFVDEPVGGKAVNCVAPEYEEVRVPDWGIKSGHFMTWMRVAGLPKFRKLWGKIDESEGTLKANTRLRVYVDDRFPVRGFGGSKSVVISTSSSLGGRNDFLGKGYLLVGLCCVVFGAWFLWKHLFPGSP